MIEIKSRTKEPSFIQIVNRLEKAFPECNTGWLIKKIARLCQNNCLPSTHGWHKPILIWKR